MVEKYESFIYNIHIMTVVRVNGVDYQIPNEKLGELLNWLQTNQVATVLDNANPNDQGKTIING